MNNVELFDGERLEIGDIVTNSFGANVVMQYEVVGVNPDFALISAAPVQDNEQHVSRIPIVLKRDTHQTAFRPTRMEHVILH